MTSKKLKNSDIFQFNLSNEFSEALEKVSDKTGGLSVNFKNNEANFTLNKDKCFTFGIVSDNQSYCFLENNSFKRNFSVNNNNPVKFLNPKSVVRNSELENKNLNSNQNSRKRKSQIVIDVTEDFVSNFATAHPKKTLNMLIEEYDYLHGIYKERYGELLQLQHVNGDYDKKFNTAWRNRNEADIKEIGDKYVKFVKEVVNSEGINRTYAEYDFLYNKLRFILSKQEEMKIPPKTTSVEPANKKKKYRIAPKHRRKTSGEKHKNI